MNTVISKVIKKHNKSEKIYCRPGDELKVIHASPPALVVESKTGYRFSLRVEETDYVHKY